MRFPRALLLFLLRTDRLGTRFRAEAATRARARPATNCHLGYRADRLCLYRHVISRRGFCSFFTRRRGRSTPSLYCLHWILSWRRARACRRRSQLDLALLFTTIAPTVSRPSSSRELQVLRESLFNRILLLGQPTTFPFPRAFQSCRRRGWLAELRYRLQRCRTRADSAAWAAHARHGRRFIVIRIRIG